MQKIKSLLVRILTGFMPSKKMRQSFRAKYLINKTKAENIENVKLFDDTNKIIFICDDGTEKRFYSIPGLEVIFNGTNSTLIVHGNVSFKNCLFNLGSNNIIEIQDSIYPILNFRMPYRMSDGSKLMIGNNFSCMGCELYMHDEPNVDVIIGNDCQFSFGITIWPSDGHTIVDDHNNILNKGESIYIGNHVWIGMHSTILKGSKIPNNSVVGANSLFLKKTNLSNNGEFEFGNIYAGIPAKSVKSNITWYRENCFEYKNQTRL